jgi:hypothetical protein
MHSVQGVIAIHLNLSFVNFSMSHQHASKGYALFEVLMAWAITTAVAVWGANLWVHQAQESAAEATSVWLLGIKQAMDLAVLEARNKIHLHQGKVDLEHIQLPQTLFELKNTGHLAHHYPDQPPLPYAFSMRIVRESAPCSNDQCSISAFMMLEPTHALGSTYPTESQASVMMRALKGQGLAVWPRQPNKLLGAQYQGANPPDSGGAISVGSVVVMSRAVMQAPPFIRLNESRAVSLSGPVTLLGNLNLKQGLVIDAVRASDTSCQVTGQVVRRAKGGLLVCENGQWRAVGDGLFAKLKPLSYQTCRNTKPLNAFLQFVQSKTPFDFAPSTSPQPGDCHCNAGFRPVLAHSARIDRHHATEKNGFVCASP